MIGNFNQLQGKEMKVTSSFSPSAQDTLPREWDKKHGGPLGLRFPVLKHALPGDSTGCNASFESNVTEHITLDHNLTNMQWRSFPGQLVVNGL